MCQFMPSTSCLSRLLVKIAYYYSVSEQNYRESIAVKCYNS